MSIKKVTARMIFDSRGNPTTEVKLATDKGVFVASCPSGASTGAEEACELRDKEKEFQGKGVQKALDNITEVLAPKLLGRSVLDQTDLDKAMIELDGTPNLARLGANAVLPVSMAVCKAAAAELEVPLFAYIWLLTNKPELVRDKAAAQTEVSSRKFRLPVPSFNVINGGEHAGNLIAVQEFMVAPVRATSFSAAMQAGVETYQALRKLLKQECGSQAVNVGDEGGFAPVFAGSSSFAEIEKALQLLATAAEQSGHKEEVAFCLDAAATSFGDANGYDLEYKNKEQAGNKISAAELTAFYEKLAVRFPLHSVEDPVGEEDWTGFATCTAALRQKKVRVVGDDLLVTNPARIEKALQHQSCNALLLKPNQIGTVTEAIRATKLALANGWGVMASHRSGETLDTFLADLSVGLGVQMIKSGAPCRGERLAKYNRLLEIELELGQRACFSQGFDLKI